MNLAGAHVLLTGATGGLGHAIARALAARGASLTLTGRRAEVLEPLAEELGGRALAVDLADPAAPARLLADAGRVDVLVANAGLPATSGFVGEFLVILSAVKVNFWLGFLGRRNDGPQAYGVSLKKRGS